ncbi:stage V sporulation protein D [Domibacillus sp. DTU_2020_1001157_1_SI_ALB_TIR_016]|uniref:stage V sporulation protein D n=1 Tax=Domibacillus sp. DTU_2020_1001157_1_SI_ALB_TIR_016 TaxID=3077789 RepID=UPI0028E37D27|nr:stage V sporulation protein D [Domibacillus sp. DTU_2020_1001157_1_SI_ALB_TIR_016]WNS79808.1 stage V sporulation protein D [Domibacillus sp. DTU_2020_1001157_1_SI_ALB_TIR_016]
MRVRMFWILLLSFLAFSALVIRTGYIQLVNGGELTDKAEELWGRSIPAEPERGLILDRNGKVLVGNKNAPTVYVIPAQIDDPEQTAKKLAAVLGEKESVLYERMTKRSSIERLSSKGRHLSAETAQAVRDLQLKGVWLGEDSIRDYVMKDRLAHIIGFTGADNQGLAGIEAYYDKKLSGKPGSIQMYTDAKGNQMPGLTNHYEEPVNGMDLSLTIDADIQAVMERELDQAEKTYKPDAAMSIAMDPNTGAILAMSSRPSYDPARFSKYDPDVYNRNLPVWSTFEPGSTFKIITLAAALEEKKVDLDKDHFNDPGYVEVDGARLRCWKREGHGHQTFLEVVQNSCNPGFVELGSRLGEKKLFSYIRKFGFGEKTGIDLYGEGTGILFTEESAGPVEAATAAFGQGVAVTPIQQVTAVSAAINGGILYEPYVAESWTNPETGKTEEVRKPKKVRRVISEETSKEVRRALENVVAKGTGRNAFVDGYRVGGKTGTAQKAKDGRYLENNHIVSFIGMAPANDPKVVIYTAIDNPKGTVQFGGTVAAPIVGKMMQDVLPLLNVEKQTNQIEKEKAWNDPDFIQVPNLIGLSKEKLKEQLINVEIVAEGAGDKVVYQSPKQGVKVERGSKVRVLLK